MLKEESKEKKINNKEKKINLNSLWSNLREISKD